MKKLKILLAILSFMIVFSFTQSYTYQVTKETQTVDMKPGDEEKEKWGALDEIVIEKYASEKGKEPKPFIELEGDLILLAFSLLSAIAGFLIGYYSRVIFSKEKK
ncbi:MAG: hypothetical protein N2712_06695 [Brevinematales bacterium]|nr:hypothetical protein [Brevinematales bacterium]